MNITDLYREMARGPEHELLEADDMLMESPDPELINPARRQATGPLPPLPSQMMEDAPAPRPLARKKQNIEEGSGNMATPNCMKCGGKLTVIHKTTRAGITMLSCPMCYTLLAAYEKR